MEKIIEYSLPEPEFDTLVSHLKMEGYHAHGYFGMQSRNTIDDGSSTVFESCARFSTFVISDDNNKNVTLRVRNSQLATCIDTYFSQSH